MAALESYACPNVVDKANKIIKRGCGGNWAPTLPEKCPGCGGVLIHTQTIRVLELIPAS